MGPKREGPLGKVTQDVISNQNFLKWGIQIIILATVCATVSMSMNLSARFHNIRKAYSDGDTCSTELANLAKTNGVYWYFMHIIGMKTPSPPTGVSSPVIHVRALLDAAQGLGWTTIIIWSMYILFRIKDYYQIVLIDEETKGSELLKKIPLMLLFLPSLPFVWWNKWSKIPGNVREYLTAGALTLGTMSNLIFTVAAVAYTTAPLKGIVMTLPAANCVAKYNSWGGVGPWAEEGIWFIALGLLFMVVGSFVVVIKEKHISKYMLNRGAEEQSMPEAGGTGTQLQTMVRRMMFGVV